jgi:sortase A
VVRKAGLALLALGVLLIAWAGITVWRGDPLTSLYTRHEQHALSKQLDAMSRSWPKTPTLASVHLTPQAAPATTAKTAEKVAQTHVSLASVMHKRAVLFRRTLRDGRALGRIVIPRIGLRMVVVEGTSESDLRLGPGHYNAASGIATSLPGMGKGKVVAIAGHRTTYLHPFRYIDELRPGDNIYLQMPYGTFRYKIYAHRVVASNDWTILRHRPYEKLVLSACHPLYSATHRWVVFARLAGEGRARA